ncbi:MAG: ATP-dependent 6-phosphofructokinase [Blastochloris sp.]|nr:ATP-dependent 6-phosphofructokinase [Blastochloris sp.]
MIKRIAVLTSGGDSPGMNPAVRAITRTGLSNGLEIIGIENGYQGIFDNEFLPLGALQVSGKIRDSGTFLSTSRCAKMREDNGPAEAVRTLREQKIDALIVIGGDGSLTGAQKINELGFPVLGLPGTIDNDIYGTDIGIGVDTALNTIIHLVDMVKATAASHRRCFVIEVMGRSCGYLALMSTVTTGSQVAVIPEYRYNMDSIITSLNRRMERKHNNSVIIVAEGVCSGADFMKRLEDNSKGKFQQEVRLTVLGHVQRGGVPTHYDRLLATRMGEFAVLGLMHGETGSMVGLVQGKMQLRDFDQILGKKKTLPSDATRLARNLGIEIGDAVET